MFTIERVKDRSTMITVIIALCALCLFLLVGCGGSDHEYFAPAVAEVDPCEATPLDLDVGFGVYTHAVYMDCEDAEVEVWLYGENEVEDFDIELRSEYNSGLPFGMCSVARAFGVVTGPRSFDLSLIQVGHWWMGGRWHVCKDMEFEGSALVTLCNEDMTISAFAFEGIELLCATATFWELRPVLDGEENGLGVPAQLFSPTETE